MPAMMRKIYLSKLLHENDWDKITRDLNRRPVEGIDGNADRNEIIKLLAKYGIENNRVTLWGTGTPLREFLWSEDMADASVYILLNINFSDIIGIESLNSKNTTVSSGHNKLLLPIKELFKSIASFFAVNI